MRVLDWAGSGHRALGSGPRLLIMDNPARSPVLPALLVLAIAALVNLVAGIHYALADGGYPARTRGNHLGGWIHLVTAGCVLVGIVMVLRGSQNTRKVLVVALLTLVVAVSGSVAGHATVRNGSNCACEGG